MQTQTDTIARKTTDIEKQRGTDRIDRQKDRNRKPVRHKDDDTSQQRVRQREKQR